MAISNRLRKLKDTLPFVIMWFLAGVLYVVIERGMLGDATVYPSTGNPYDFDSSLVVIAFSSTLIGLLQGLAEATILKNFMKAYAFGTKMLVKILLYALLLFAFLIVTAFPLNSNALGLPLFHPEVVNAIWLYMSNFVFWSVMLYAAVFIGLALFISELMQNLGSNVVINFFTGRYHSSKVEDRVFMFLDMKSSTTIAEKLGHEVYYQLLNAYYEDMTEAIFNTRGEVYQYVGDEIVVSWRSDKGIQDNNCLRCFFLIRQEIAKHALKYKERFGLVPEFKAGLHIGKVTTGEVGVLKKEILFTGDAINTTARIQSLCNEQKTDLLLSKDLVSALKLDGSFTTEQRGKFALRGRDQQIELLTVHPIS